MKKIFLILILALFTACFNNKQDEKDNASGVLVKRDGNTVKVYSNQDILGLKLSLNKKISNEDISLSSNKLKILQSDNENTIISIVSIENEIKKGEEIFSLNSSDFISLNLIEDVKKSDVSSMNVKKADSPQLLGDFNNDGVVKINDFSSFVVNYGGTNTLYDIAPATLGTGLWANIYAYVQKDGKVNISDFVIFGQNYMKEKVNESYIKIQTNDLTKVGEETEIMVLGTYYAENGEAAGVILEPNEITWTFSDSSLAKIENMTLTALKAGFLTLTASDKSGLKDTIEIEIIDNITEFDGIKIHVKGFTNVWAWDDASKAYFTDVTWPGKLMADDSIVGWKYIEFPEISKINLLFNNSGTNKTDDIKITEKGEYWIIDGKLYNANPLDDVIPTIKINSPIENQELTGEVSIKVSASDNSGIEKVEYYFADKKIGESSISPYSYTWNTALSPSQKGELKAIAYDLAGNTAETSINLSTKNPNVAPVANAGGNKKVGLNTSVRFDASKSYDSNGTIVSYKWSFGKEGKTVDYSYSKVGTYEVSLTVIDDEGASSTDKITVEVVESAVQYNDFRDETIYFMMTDRFADGDTTNNNIWEDEYLPGGEADKYKVDEAKTGVLSYYHGGDFKGIIKNLDYIKDMGFTAIWITPAVKQPEGRYYWEGDGEPYEASAFHGYWAHDFDQIDPHLHSQGKESDGWSDFKNLADEIHAKGMKLMLDVVINHGHEGEAAPKTKWADDSLKIIMDGQTWTYDKTSDPYGSEVVSKTPFVANGFFNYAGGYTLSGLLDFNERGEDGKDAREHLKNVYKKFIDNGVDAMRIDTAAYVTNEWMGEFADAMANHAQSLGNDNFYLMSEGWCGRYDAMQRAAYDKTGKLHMIDMQASCLDFPGQMSGVFKSGGNYGMFENVISNDLAQGLDNASFVGMFVDNHDCYRNNSIYSEQEYMNALNYIYLFRGIPIVFYGTEAMYSWEGAYASTNKDDIVSRWMLGQKGIDYVKSTKPNMYKHIKLLNEARSKSLAVRRGEQENIVLSGDQAVFKRNYNNGEAIAYVAISKGAGFSQSFSGIESGSYKKITLSGFTLTEETVSLSASASVNVPANGFVILEKQ